MKPSLPTRLNSLVLILSIGVGCPACKYGDDSKASESGQEGPAPARRSSSHGSRESRANDQRTATAKEEDFEHQWSRHLHGSKSLWALTHLAEEMSSQGHIKVALDMIHRDFGEGEDRNQLIMYAFMGVTGSLTEIEHAFLSLQSDREKQPAVAGLALGMSRRESLEDLDESDFAFLGDRKDRFLESVVRAFASNMVFRHKQGSSHGSIQTPEDGAARLHLALSWADSRGNADLAKSLMIGYGSRFPFDCFDMLGPRNLQLSRAEMESLTRHMVTANPHEAVSRLAGSSGREDELSLAVQLWANRDLSQVLQWHSENESSLPAGQSEAVASGFAKQAAGRGNFEDAWEWTKQIVDPDTKRKAEGEVWSKEREVIRQTTNKDPSGTIQSLVSGQSKHANYWIEEAMVTWIAKEPEKAEEWYRKTWSSLPPAKAQYVAAAYAKEALRLGDPATARQWTSLIQDPKTKARIVASINDANAAQGQ